MDALFIEALEISNEVSKDISLFEMVELQYEQMYKDAETKVTTEGGTSEDLMYLYKEADEEAGEQKESIFTKIINGVKNLIQKIIDAITGFFSKFKKPEEGEEEIEIPAQEWADVQEANNFCSKNPGQKIVEAVKNHKKTAIIVASSAVAAGATVAIDAATGWKMLNSIKSGLGTLKGNTIDKLFSKGANNEDAATVSQVTNNSVGFVASAASKLQAALVKGKKTKPATESTELVFDDNTDFTEAAHEVIKDQSYFESILAEIEGELFAEEFSAKRYLDSLGSDLFGNDVAMKESANLFGDTYYDDGEKYVESETDRSKREILEMIENL